MSKIQGNCDYQYKSGGRCDRSCIGSSKCLLHNYNNKIVEEPSYNPGDDVEEYFLNYAKYLLQGVGRLMEDHDELLRCVLDYAYDSDNESVIDSAIPKVIEDLNIVFGIKDIIAIRRCYDKLR